MSPNGKVAGASLVMIGLASTRSLAVAVPIETEVNSPVASSVTSAGMVSAGVVVSSTVTVNEAAPSFPAWSLAVHLTVVSPNGNVEPDVGVHEAETGPSTSSSADAEKFTSAPDPLVASSVISAGTDTTGGLASEGAAPMLNALVHGWKSVPMPPGRIKGSQKLPTTMQSSAIPSQVSHQLPPIVESVLVKTLPVESESEPTWLVLS